MGRFEPLNRSTGFIHRPLTCRERPPNRRWQLSDLQPPLADATRYPDPAINRGPESAAFASKRLHRPSSIWRLYVAAKITTLRLTATEQLEAHKAAIAEELLALHEEIHLLRAHALLTCGSSYELLEGHDR